jgi:hypothetical protein
MAALRIISDEVRHHGVCALHIDAIAARAGTCRTTVKNALREARRLNLVTVQERRRRVQKSLTNHVRIVSPEWMAWIRIGVKKLTTPEGGCRSAPTAVDRLSRDITAGAIGRIRRAVQVAVSARRARTPFDARAEFM